MSETLQESIERTEIERADLCRVIAACESARGLVATIHFPGQPMPVSISAKELAEAAIERCYVLDKRLSDWARALRER